MTETRQVRMGAGDFSLILPGTWASIPLNDSDAMKKRISALVKQQLGADDRLARRRIQLRNELVETAEKAAAEGALSFSLSIELLPGAPFPAALMAKRRSWPNEVKDATALAAAERLAKGFPTAEILSLDSGDVMARIATTEQQRYVAETTPSLMAEYWTPAPDADELLYITISAPMVPQSGLFIELFDTMIASLVWNFDVAQAVFAVQRSLDGD
ncbi:hypothetical protein [Leifsonia sp. Root112D2]|uniref:hypothetical protein n=1 Tax=Leifsonia sp. Root112D2 TaxID=1736426 RepID=UPI0006FB2064|nr:hypothetical protein [Leifsonia sp. Root112D2]KQV07162.1 hypothetical protein ASC63_07540 [Leifsonia sp. Root112D2]